VHLVLKFAAVRCCVLQCAAVCCSVLQCVAVRCRVLQCVAVCCSILKGVAECVNESCRMCESCHTHTSVMYVTMGESCHVCICGVSHM